MYHGEEERMARIGHKLLQELPMSSLWEMLEKQQERESRKSKKAPAWVAWRDFALDQPWCADPLLVNRDDLRRGQVCLAGRGLRASAMGLCRFLLAEALQAGASSQSSRPCTLDVDSVEEWEELGQCLQVNAGWQHLTFRRLDGQGEVAGRGHLDASTGSLAFCVPGASVAVLLTCTDTDARRAGHELLTLVAASLGLEPTWHLNAPSADVPDRVETAAVFTNDEEDGDVSVAIRRLEREVVRLTKALEAAQQNGHLAVAQGSMNGSEASQSSHPLSGRWQSSDTEGLEDMLDALGAPAMARSLAKRLKRSLWIDVKGDQVTIHQSASLGGRKLDDNQSSFRVGQPFEGQAPIMNARFQGQARWMQPGAPGAAAGSAAAGTPILLVEKRLKVAGHDVLLEEVFACTAEGCLLHRTKIVGRGQLEVSLRTAEDRQLLYSCLDQRSCRVKRQVQINGVDIQRFGRVVGPVPLANMVLPCVAKLQYDSIQSTTFFEKEGSGRRRTGRTSAPQSFLSDVGSHGSAMPTSSSTSSVSGANAAVQEGASSSTASPKLPAMRIAPLGVHMSQALL